MSKEMINIALPKGRLGKQVYAVFEAAGYHAPDMLSETRQLIFEDEQNKVCFFWVKAADVAIYVERGAADIGIVGKDILLETNPNVYELLDLKRGACRMMVAAPKDFHDNTDRTLRVATSFPNIARKFYSGKSRDIDIIKLNGSIELAPLLGLSDVIVDLVETGNTLKANDLIPTEEIVPVSARLIANKAISKFKSEAIQKLVNALRKSI